MMRNALIQSSILLSTLLFHFLLCLHLSHSNQIVVQLFGDENVDRSFAFYTDPPIISPFFLNMNETLPYGRQRTFSVPSGQYHISTAHSKSYQISQISIASTDVYDTSAPISSNTAKIDVSEDETIICRFFAGRNELFSLLHLIFSSEVSQEKVKMSTVIIQLFLSPQSMDYVRSCLSSS